MKKVLTYFVIAALAVVGAFNYHLFIFPNSFAPAGINGLCTMIQYLTDISIGYLSLLINIPLAIAVFFKVSRPMALRSMTYVSVFSLAILLLENVDLSGFAYATDTGTSTILGPLVAGIISGACFSILMRGGSVTAVWTLSLPSSTRKSPIPICFGCFSCSIAAWRAFPTLCMTTN